MIALLVIAIFILGIIFYLLAASFYVEVNSGENIYRVRFQRLAQARIYVTEGSVFTELQCLGWRKQIDLLIEGADKEDQKEGSKKKEKGLRISIQKMRAILGSFKLTTCKVSVDTGDMALNGILYPWFFWIGRSMKRDVQINFCDKNEIVFEVENNFLRMLRAYITH